MSLLTEAMSLKHELVERGYVKGVTCEGVFEKLEQGGMTFYVGFDCTASSLHVGNLLVLMFAKVLQRYGNRPVLLLGGATSGIGDPSGRSAARPMLSKEEVAINKAGIKASIEKFIDFGSGALIVDNADWIPDMSFLEFLGGFARHFSVNQMLSMDFARTRLGKNMHLSLMEFSYVVLQSLDFLHLHEAYGCNLQIGGSDQWGNIVSGVELIRKVKGERVFGITTPLLANSSGKKMGKSESGAIWLNKELLSPYGYFQYWRNVHDLDVLRIAKAYCDWPPLEFERFRKVAQEDINLAKVDLAFRLTSLCHGNQAAVESKDGARLAFGSACFNESAVSIPQYYLGHTEFEAGLSLAGLLYRSELAKSISQAKKLISGSGVKINGIRVEDPLRAITSKDFQGEGFAKVSLGKKKHLLVRLGPSESGPCLKSHHQEE